MTTATDVSLTGKVRKPMTESGEFGAFARRILRALGRRVADRDIEALADLAALQTELDTVMQAAVDRLRSDEGGGYSYTDVARVLGITRQAAQQRFSRKG